MNTSLARRLRATITLEASGARRTPISPRGRMYRPHLVPEGSDVMLGICFVDGPEFIAPGGSGEVEFECIYDGVSYDELRPGVRFRIVEGPNTVGTGIVLAR